MKLIDVRREMLLESFKLEKDLKAKLEESQNENQDPLARLRNPQLLDLIRRKTDQDTALYRFFDAEKQLKEKKGSCWITPPVQRTFTILRTVNWIATTLSTIFQGIFTPVVSVPPLVCSIVAAIGTGIDGATSLYRDGAKDDLGAAEKDFKEAEEKWHSWVREEREQQNAKRQREEIFQKFLEALELFEASKNSEVRLQDCVKFFDQVPSDSRYHGTLLPNRDDVISGLANDLPDSNPISKIFKELDEKEKESLPKVDIIDEENERASELHSKRAKKSMQSLLSHSAGTSALPLERWEELEKRLGGKKIYYLKLHDKVLSRPNDNDPLQMASPQPSTGAHVIQMRNA